MAYQSKKLIVFDLDGTLTESKQPMDLEVAELLRELLGKKRVAIIGGGSWQKFNEQFVSRFSSGAEAGNLYLFPTDATAFYRYGGGGWVNVYEEKLTIEERKEITKAMQETVAELGFDKPEKLYGEQIEDRNTQITFSALGQQAPVSAKAVWDPDHKKRDEIIKRLNERIPGFDAKIGGMTSVDVTRKGIDKAYGIKQMEKYLEIPRSEMLYVGDALFPGGNDYPAKEAGVEAIQVSGPKETKKIIQRIIDTDGDK